jgi:D-alanyl-D-alanine carboxypeptidase
LASAFSATVAPISSGLEAEMRGRSWHPDPRCPAFESLRLITLTHWDFAGAARTGQLVVAGRLAEEIVAIFAGLYALRFPIARMELVDGFGADDDAAMAANNTSCFNFRNVAGTDVLSKHALGAAIDINPVLNPMVVDGRIFPPAGAAYLDRAAVCPGMIVRPGPVVDLFERHGWQWGGDWAPMKDYHHFVKGGVAVP